MGSGDVFKIIEASAKNNAKNDLTGFLVFSGGRFFQFLEGPENAIDALLEKLEKDERHSNMKVLSRSSAVQRSFPKWRMKRLASDFEAELIEENLPELKDAPSQVKRLLTEFLEPSARLRA